ncbi:S-adenosyl-L-methionine-dependent methyltransferase [Peziza echinospora]|nr:S-adenosyl-L-methionine-dependent methyltransferase [Peziza echinospora]
MPETFTLSSSIVNYQYENGRRYHAYRQGAYFFPNDEQQNNQLEIFHHVYSLMLDGELYCAPIGNSPKTILDIGTGTGIWAINMADRFPEAQVLGTDLSAIQPEWVPPNVRFEIDDCESEWTYPENYFDFIHIRCMFGSIADWPKLISQAHRSLKRGGYIEIIEHKLPYECDDGTMPLDSAIYRWSKHCVESSRLSGKSMEICQHIPQWLDQTGYTNIMERVVKTPMGGSWCETEKERELGKWNAVNLMEGLEGFSLALFTRFLGWNPIEVQALLGLVRTEVQQQKVHSYYKTYFFTAQKPHAPSLPPLSAARR